MSHERKDASHTQLQHENEAPIAVLNSNESNGNPTIPSTGLQMTGPIIKQIVPIQSTEHTTVTADRIPLLDADERWQKNAPRTTDIITTQQVVVFDAIGTNRRSFPRRRCRRIYDENCCLCCCCCDDYRSLLPITKRRRRVNISPIMIVIIATVIHPFLKFVDGKSTPSILDYSTMHVETTNNKDRSRLKIDENKNSIVRKNLQKKDLDETEAFNSNKVRDKGQVFEHDENVDVVRHRPSNDGKKRKKKRRKKKKRRDQTKNRKEKLKELKTVGKIITENIINQSTTSGKSNNDHIDNTSQEIQSILNLSTDLHNEHSDNNEEIIPQNSNIDSERIGAHRSVYSIDSVHVSPWVYRLLTKSMNTNYLVPIPIDYCADKFNQVQLPSLIESIGISSKPSFNNDQQQQPNDRYSIYNQALQLLVDEQPIFIVRTNEQQNPQSVDESYDFYDHIPEYLDKAATALYLMLHQRYVTSPRGLDAVRRKLVSSAITSMTDGTVVNSDSSRNPLFGRCPRQRCCGAPMLPIGDSDDFIYYDNQPSDESEDNDVLVQKEMDMRRNRVKRYCPCCNEVFYHWESAIDGCAWGTSFCNLFLLVHGEEVFRPWIKMFQTSSTTTTIDNYSTRKKSDQESLYQPRIFGFRVHPSVTNIYSSSFYPI